MSNILKVTTQNLIHDLQRGWSERRIARQLQLNRRTVRRYAQKQAREDGDESPFSQTEVEAKCTTISIPGYQGLNESKCTSNSTAGSGVPLGALVRPTKPGRKSQCEPFTETIAGKIGLGLSAQRIHQDLVEHHGFAGSYQSVKRYVARMCANSPTHQR